MSLDFAAFKSTALVLLLPPVPFLALIGFAWLGRRRRGSVLFLAVGLLGLWLSCTEAAGEWLSRRLLDPPPALEWQALPAGPRTAVLVLGAGVRNVVPEYGQPGMHVLTAERVHYGVWLAKRGDWPLGFAGGVGWAATDQAQPEAEVVMRVAREDYGLPLRWSESRSRDTRENALNSLPLLARDGIERVLLVTHDSHMPRALRAFEPLAAPLKMQIVPAPLGLRHDSYGAVMDWCPTVAGFARVRYVIYEVLAALTGR